MKHEEGLQYIWKKRLLPGSPLKTTCGLKVEVFHPGEQNSNAGPDFFNARIKLGPFVWAGNVEMHPHASQWNQHGHHLDPAYDNVILHVVHGLNAPTRNSKGRMIPTLLVDPALSQIQLHQNLSTNIDWPPCQSSLSKVSKRSLEKWLGALYMERLSEKVKYASHILSRFPKDRDKALFLALASGFGLPINHLPFEIMAAGIPMQLLLEIKENLPFLEALLFGHSGLINESNVEDSYTSTLKANYTLLKKELPGQAVPPHLWKFLRIRPASFPTLRMAQFASFLHSQFPLEEGLLKLESLKLLEQKLHQSASEYWNTHYTFGKASPHLVKTMGRQAIQHLIINVLIPYLVAIDLPDHQIGIHSSDREKLLKMRAESNYIVRNWSKFGVKALNAVESQALIQLYKGYCAEQRCDQCIFGNTR